MNCNSFMSCLHRKEAKKFNNSMRFFSSRSQKLKEKILGLWKKDNLQKAMLKWCQIIQYIFK